MMPAMFEGDRRRTARLLLLLALACLGALSVVRAAGNPGPASAAAGGSVPAAAAGAPAPAESVSAVAAAGLERGVRVHHLANGMTFLLLERHEAPIISGTIRFKVGGLDEDSGRSGLAHLFEHLAFKGTTRIGTRDPAREADLLRQIEAQVDRLEAERRREPADPERRREAEEQLAALQAESRKLAVPNEFMQIYEANGSAGLNASTDKDLTSYYVSLPANRLELWCLMESERLRDGVLREFYTERDVVTEERRLRVETSPLGKLYETLLGTAFAGDAYGIPTVGTMEDLQGLRTADALEFRRRHYRPENAVVALVGDFRAEQAISLIDTYFSDWRGEPLEAKSGGAGGAGVVGTGGAPGAGTAAALPAVSGAVDSAGAAGSRPSRVEVKFPSQPYLLMGFNKPVYPHPDAVKFQVLDEHLNGGRSSLLQRRLVVERQVALDLFTFEGPGQRRDNLFIIGAIPQAPHTAAEVESAILEELAVIAARPIPEKDLQKVRNRVQASFIRGLASNSGLASQLTYFHILYGDWKQLLRLLEQADRVTAADLQQIVTRYLAPDRRVTGELVTQEEGAAAPEPPAPETKP